MGTIARVSFSEPFKEIRAFIGPTKPADVKLLSIVPGRPPGRKHFFFSLRVIVTIKFFLFAPFRHSVICFLAFLHL